MSHYLGEKKTIIFLNKPLICYPLIWIMTSILTFVVKGGVHWSVPCLQNCEAFRGLTPLLLSKYSARYSRRARQNLNDWILQSSAVSFRGAPTARALRWRKARPWLKAQINQSHASVCVWGHDSHITVGGFLQSILFPMIWRKLWN